jgi:hypothetical protein
MLKPGKPPASAGGAVTSQPGAQYDGTRTLAGSWSWPDLVSGI